MEKATATVERHLAEESKVEETAPFEPLEGPASVHSKSLFKLQTEEPHVRENAVEVGQAKAVEDVTSRELKSTRIENKKPQEG